MHWVALTISGFALLIGAVCGEIWGPADSEYIVVYALGAGAIVIAFVGASVQPIVAFAPEATTVARGLGSRLLSFHDREQKLRERVFRSDAPYLLIGFAVGAGYVAAIVATAVFSLPYKPADAVIYLAAVIGVAAFVLALPALYYAVNTDARTRQIMEALAKRELSTPQGLNAVRADDTQRPMPTGVTPESAPLREISVDHERFDVFAPADVPPRVFDDLLAQGPEEVGLSAGALATNLQYAAREPGDGNRPWVFGLEGQDKVLRVSYDGRDEDAASVTVVPVGDGSGEL